MQGFHKFYQVPREVLPTSNWFLVKENSIYIHREKLSNPLIPKYGDVKSRLKDKLIGSGYMGSLNGIDCYYAYIEEEVIDDDQFEFVNIRSTFSSIDEAMFQAIGQAHQLALWDRSSYFCGKCGSPTVHIAKERAKQCSGCNQIIYPRISPAVIVAVTKGDKILLARNSKFKNAMHSVLAGFVDAGESLEECVRREILEEANIEVANIKYFGSQPWPFPDSLMCGFIAEYHSGDLKVDGVELTFANWFSKDNLPDLPLPFSIARKLINHWLNG